MKHKDLTDTEAEAVDLIEREINDWISDALMSKVDDILSSRGITNEDRINLVLKRVNGDELDLRESWFEYVEE